MKRTHLRQRGVAIVVMMTGIFLLMVIGVSLIGISGHVRQNASYGANKIAARTAADAALQMGYNAMQIRLVTKPWDNGSLPEGSGTLANSDESYAYKVTGSTFSGHVINATGASGSVERKIAARFKTVGLFEYAILVKEVIDIGSNALVDGINYTPDDRILEIASRSGMANSMLIGSGAIVEGDVLVGGDDPTEAVKLSPGSNVTGDIGRMMDIWEPPIIEPPATLAAMVSGGEIKVNTTLTTSGKYDKINLGNNQVLTIDGEVELYVTGDIILGNDAQIQVDPSNPDSSLTIYAGGDIEEKNGAAFNNLTADAKKLAIYGQAGCTNIDFKNSGTFYGTIYAPNADVVFHNSLEMTGAVVANSFEQKSTSSLHYDVELREISPELLGLHFVIDRWSEE